MFTFRRLTVPALAVSMIAAAAHHAAGQSNFEIMGYTALVERLGAENVPTGEHVSVVHTEAPTSNGDYGPNQSSSQFTGKTFHAMSGPPGSSSHATSVGGQMYGNTSSMTSGVSDIWLFEASHWIYAGYLRVGTALQPLPPPGGAQVFNNSWIGSLSTDDATIEALRRADWATSNHDVLIVGGVANGGSGLPLLRDSFNGLSVGRSVGGHSIAPTPPNMDVPGRMKPEIVAPGNTTSSATPKVSSAAILLFDTVHTDAALAANANASKPVVIKAALLAGATHSDFHGEPWTNNPVTSGPDRGRTSQPIDDVVGTGTVNVNISHLILTGGQQPASVSSDALTPSSLSGWDLTGLPPVSSGGSAFWQFETGETAEEVSIVVTWNRIVSSTFANYGIAGVEIELWRVESDGALVSLVGDGGLDWFAAGNVVSESSVDNIQHLYIQGLEPGKYVLEARRTDSILSTWPVAAAWHFHGVEDAVPGIPGDLTGDGTVGVADLLILLAAWGPCAECNAGACPADLDGDCAVGVSDLLILLANWG